MSYSILLSEETKDTLDRLNRSTANRIIKRLESICVDPYGHVKRLHGVELFSLRVGDCRVIMDIQDNKIVIFVIKTGHRGKVYERL